MSENKMPEQDEVALNAVPEPGTIEPTEGTPEPVLPEALREVDPEKMKQIREKLSSFLARSGKTISGSEDPDAPPAEPTQDSEGRPVGKVTTGADVDWREYDLDFNVRHLYPAATLRETPEGTKWVVMLDEFYSTERTAKQHGKKVNAPGYADGSVTEPLNLGEYLTQMVNGPEGWTIASILPGSSGQAIVLFRKQVPCVLPDPQPLKKVEEVEAPKDAELKQIEDAALQFAANEGLTPPAMVEDTGVEEEPVVEDPNAARFLTRDQVGVEPGEVIPARETGSLIRNALDKARGLEVPADVPGGIQPPAIEVEGGVIAAGVENVRQGMRNILKGPDFGSVGSV